MEKMCRCCLKKGIHLIEIQMEDEEKFQTCTDNKEFNKYDGLSQSCCRYCYTKINDIYAFQQECKESHLYLKELQFKNNIKSENNEFNISYDDDMLKIEDLEYNIVENPIEHFVDTVNYENEENLDTKSKNEINMTSKFPCNKCKKSFKSKRNLKIHLTITHKNNSENKLYKCRLCEDDIKKNIFTSERNLKIHMTRAHKTEKDCGIDSDMIFLENKSYKCQYCNNNFKDESMLLRHLHTKHFENSENGNEELMDCLKFEKPEVEETTTFSDPKSSEYKHAEDNNMLFVAEHKEIVQNERSTENNLKEKYKNINGRKYLCDICGVKFTRKEFLVTHIKIKHLKVMKFTCKICWKGFVNYNLFHNHLIKKHFKNKIKTAHEMEQYVINHEAEYSNFLLWKDTKVLDKTDLKQIRFNCTLCDKKYDSKITLKLHFSSSHLKLTNISHKCNICKKIFRFKSSLVQHSKIHNIIIKYNCKLCGLGFITKSLFRCHLRYSHLKSKEITSDYIENCLLKNTQNPIKIKSLCKNTLKIHRLRYNCDYCNNTFITKSSLQSHLRRKHEKYIIPNQLECSICNKIFPNNDLYRNHMNDNHPGEYSLQILVNCKICNKSYSKKSIKNHLRTHQNRPKHIQCPECGRTFFSKSTYTYHQKTHTNERPYKCDNCPKAFITKYQLVMHSITHSNAERPKRYQCNFCGRGCASTSEFTVHLRIHTNERPFKCTQCDKGFLTKSHLRNHLYTHTGEKNYKCKEDGCKSAYSSVSSLKKHYFQVHCPEDQKLFQCDLCLKRFGQRTFLNQHRKAHGKIARMSKN